MALISMRQLLDHAAEHGYGVPAFNVNNLEQVQAIMQAADKTDSPVIMQASAGARKYAGEPFLRHLIEAADQDEIDHYWERLTNGGEESQCGWLKDRYGLSWQVVPAGWEELLEDPDREKVNRVMTAMLQMKKFDIVALEAAAAGA